MDYNKLFINGKYVDSHSNEFIEIINPATEEFIGKVPKGNKEDVDDAVKAARNAFKTFKYTSLEYRIEIMEKFNDYFREHEDEICDVVMKELGSPISFTHSNQVGNQTLFVDRFIKDARNHVYERKEEHALVIKEPVGVIGCITPWNYPIWQIVLKVIPAILMGNTVVLKPSQQTPMSAYHFVEAFRQAGLPDGVLNLVTGTGSEVGEAIASHPEVDQVSFTGSTTAGVKVGKNAIDSVKRITLELGGKSPSIFLDDSYLDCGVQATLGIVMNNTGQTCAAWTRAIVLNDIKEEFRESIKKEFKKYNVGDPANLDTKIGPLSSKKQYEKVVNYIEKGKNEFDILIEGQDKLPDKGYFVNPIIFENVDNKSEIAQDEIFGPVLCVIYVDTVEEAIDVANDTMYGLAGAVFGEKDLALKVAKELQTGTVAINDSPGDIGTPFGGYKKSGIGRENGPESLEEYLETKSINILHD